MITRHSAADDAAMDMAYSDSERLADTWVHGIGVSAGVIGAIGLMIASVTHGEPILVLAMGLYATGLVLMLSLSAAYNLVTEPGLRERLRAADHAAIYVMIAGTYSPLALIVLENGGGRNVFAFVWAIAIAGAALKVCCPRRFERTAIVAYLALGWTFVWLWNPLVASMAPGGLWLLGAGAVLYTVGVGFHLSRLPYHNALWHLCVLLAAMCHYGAIMRYVAIPFMSRDLRLLFS